MKLGGTSLLIVLVVMGVIVVNAAFIVDERRQAIVFQFGEFVREETTSGLKWKIPFVQNVEYLDRRILELNLPDIEATSRDQRRLVVDAFARYRITDPRQFYRTFRIERVAGDRLESITNSALRSVLGQECFLVIIRGNDVDFDLTDDVTSEEESEEARACRPDAITAAAAERGVVTRADLMEAVFTDINRQAEEGNFGIEVVDFRIRRADLPEANSNAIFLRMEQERVQEATLVRAQGDREALRMRAEADRQYTVTLAEASRDSAILRGQGDGCRNLIYAQAFGVDKDFFSFYRSMQSYERALQNQGTTLVLSPDSQFFSYFSDQSPPPRETREIRARGVVPDIDALRGPCAAFTDLLSPEAQAAAE